MIRFTAVACLGFATFLAWSVARAEVARDFVLLLDDSGSMRNIDSNYLMRRIAGKFVRDAGPETAVAIYLFSDKAELLAPLSVLGEPAKKTQLIDKLERLRYRGRRTNLPDAVTKAMDELNVHGRHDAVKYLIVLTDGLVDTGERYLDQEGTDWLREVATRDAVRDGIKIFSIALAGRTDEALLRQLAERTNGAFFSVHRVAELPDVFKRIAEFRTPANDSSHELPNTNDAVTARASDVSSAMPSTKGPTLPHSDEAAKRNKTSLSLGKLTPEGPEQISPKKSILSFDKIGNKLVLGTGLSLLLLSSLAWFAFHSKSKPKMVRAWQEHDDPQATAHSDTFPGSSLSAYLLDTMGVTGRSSYRLSERKTMIGRVYPDASEAMGCIIVDSPSVGRRHALVERRRGGFWVTDLDSKNGTYINGRLLREPTYLLHGDRLHVHHVEFEFALRGLGSNDVTIPMDDAMKETTESHSERITATAARAVDLNESRMPTQETSVRKGSAQTAKERLFAEVGSRSVTED